ncbi:DUF6768 family protein [Balneola sp. MJW-20]|uniref:DUF6768 family protein n=1 Tax=Gracilimonas aurantiaca TaxID=3234185 RepID=UPI0034673E8C
MKKQTDDIDTLITESLNKEEAEFYKNLGEEGLFAQWGGLYKGKLGKWAVLTTIIQLIVTVNTVWFSYLYFTANDPLLMARYGGIALIFLILNTAVKLWHWMQMDKNALLREIKRLEFQVSVLSEKAPSDR